MEPLKKEQATENGNQTLHPSQGTAEVNTTTVHFKDLILTTGEILISNQEHVDSAPGLQCNQQQVPGGHQPPKKKGFQITSVKDPADGEESADELDESHTSYSDMSYSRTTDIDHDQESSASEDTLNTTVQDGMQSLSTTTAMATSSLDGLSKPAGKPVQTVMVNHIQSGKVDTTKDIEQKQEVMKSPVTSPVVEVSDPALGDKNVTTLPQSSSQSAQPKAPTKVVTGPNQTCHTTETGTTSTASKAAPAPGTALAKGGASRVYKVVKRESFLPVKRERGRWTCFDYFDSQSPNLSFVVQSASDTRLNYHEQSSHPNNILPLSTSATSVPSSASSFSLQHSDSNSSVYRDSHHIAGVPSSVQHSASTSSVNYDLESRRIQMPAIVKPVTENAEEKSLEERTEGDVIKSAIKYVTNMGASEDDDTSTRSGRIDNKIEAAMDLVKKHLMLAVRDEVDVLKEKIVELQDDNFKMKKENDLLKGFLTSDQWTAVQQAMTKQVIAQPQKSTTHQPIQPNIPGYNVPMQLPVEKPTQTPTQVTPTQQPVALTGSVIPNATIHHGYVQQPTGGTGNVQLPAKLVNPGVVNQGCVQPTAQGGNSALGQTIQHISQKTTIQSNLAAPASSAVTSVQTQYPQPQALYQQAPLTQQKLQAFVQQQQQVYPQGQVAPSQPAYQAAPHQQSQQPTQVTPNLSAQPTYQGPNTYAQGHTPSPAGVQRPVGQPAALVMPRQQSVAGGMLPVTSPTNPTPPSNQQQTFQAATPTHVASPAPTQSTFVQQNVVSSSGKTSEARAPQS